MPANLYPLLLRRSIVSAPSSIINLSSNGKSLLTKRTTKLISAIFLLLVVLYFEEGYLGYIHSARANWYSRVVYRPLTIAPRRLASSPQPHNSTTERGEAGAGEKIAVLTVVERAGDLEAAYRLATRTLHCYCLLHGYEYMVVDLSVNASLALACPQPVFMYRRHCVVAEVLRRRSDLHYVLFADADMAVINPNHLLEDYLHEEEPAAGGADLIFAERLFTNELMAGSYFARNTEFARDFLFSWAEYAYQLPNGGYGTDNAAIHLAFIERFCPNCSDELVAHCRQLWEKCHNYEQILFYTSCVRVVLGERTLFKTLDVSGEMHRALLVTNLSRMWARDGWLSDDSWSEQDFIIHGWQRERRDWPNVYGHWHSPLVDDEAWQALELNSTCTLPTNAPQMWPYKDSFIREKEWVRGRLHEARMDTKLRYLHHLQEIYQLFTA